MIDFILFDEKPFQTFVDWLKARDIPHTVERDDEGFEIAVPEDLDEALLDAIDAQYDLCMDMNRELVDAQDREQNTGYQMAGIQVTLRDGRVSHADIDPALMTRVLGAISPEEFGVIVEAIAEAVENPQTKSFCQRMREKG